MSLLTADRSAHAKTASRRVRVLRIVLPLIGVSVVAALFWAPMRNTDEPIPLPPTPAQPQLTMEKPRFTGIDDQNRPFSIWAERARQLPDNMLVVDLTALQADLQTADGARIAGAARLGRMDQEKKRLWLGGAVTLERNDGARFMAEEMFVDLNRRTAWSDRPARLSGPFGVVEGEGFRIFDGGKVMLFTGKSRAILNTTPPDVTMPSTKAKE